MFAGCKEALTSKVHSSFPRGTSGLTREEEAGVDGDRGTLRLEKLLLEFDLGSP